jgi:hypothetical protein
MAAAGRVFICLGVSVRQYQYWEDDMSENLPATIHDQALMPQTFDGMMKQAEVLVRSGLLPAEVKTPAAAVAIMMTGRELSIPPMQAFRSIYVVKGKPTLSAQLMGALIFRAGHSYKVAESTNESCTIEFRRKTGETYRHTFTIDDAERAGLKGGVTWKQYPKAMLFSRCMSAGARAFMPDVIAGMYTPEEIAGEAVRFDGEEFTVIEGEVHEAEPPKREHIDWGAFERTLAGIEITPNSYPAILGTENPAEYEQEHTRDDLVPIYKILKYGHELDMGPSKLCEMLGVDSLAAWVDDDPDGAVEIAKETIDKAMAGEPAQEEML